MRHRVDELHGAGAGREATELEREACEAVEWLWLESRCGRAAGPDDLDPLEWALLVTWEGREREHQRAHRQKMNFVAE